MVYQLPNLQPPSKARLTRTIAQCTLGVRRRTCGSRIAGPLFLVDGKFINRDFFFVRRSSIALIELSMMFMSCTLLAKKAEFSMFSSAHSRSASKSKSFIFIKLVFPSKFQQFERRFEKLLLPLRLRSCNCFVLMLRPMPANQASVSSIPNRFSSFYTPSGSGACSLLSST